MRLQLKEMQFKISYLILEYVYISMDVYTYTDIYLYIFSNFELQIFIKHTKYCKLVQLRHSFQRRE